MTIFEMNQLIDILHLFKNLEEIDFSNNFLNDDGIIVFCDYLIDNPIRSIQSIDIHSILLLLYR